MKIDIYNVNSNRSFDIVKNKVKRDWMDNTYLKHAYKCLPVSSMNTHGWSIVLKEKTVVHWDEHGGGDDLKILKGPLQSNISGGFVSFDLPYLIQTPKDFYTVFFPNPNWIYEGATPLSFIIRTDWFPSTFQCAWKLHNPGRYTIEKDTPLISFMPYPKYLIDEIDINLYDNGIECNEALSKKRQDYSDYVAEEYDKLIGKEYEFPYVYKKGLISESYGPQVEDPDWRPNPKSPEMIEYENKIF